MFLKISGSHVLGDFVGVNTTAGGSAIQFVATDAGTPKYTLTQEMIDSGSFDDEMVEGKVDKMMYYVSYDEAKENSEVDDDTPVEEWICKPGWYLASDTMYMFLMNNEPIPFGTGFLFKPESDTAQLQTAGEVAQGDTAIQDLTSEIWTPVGNAFPNDVDLGQLVLMNGSAGGSSIQFVDDDAGTPKYTLTQEMIDSGSFDDEMVEGKVDKMMYYVSYDEAKENSEIEDDTPVEEWVCKPGWYLASDTMYMFLMNDETVKRGGGFLFKPESDSATLVFPGL